MKGTYRVLLADLSWLLSGYRATVLLLLLPAVVLVLVAQLRTRVQEFTLLIAGAPAADGVEARQLEEGIQIWEQLSVLRVSRVDRPLVDPEQVMRGSGVDLVLNIGDAGDECWRLYTAETNPARLALIRQVGAGIERSLLLIARNRDEQSPAACGPPQQVADKPTAPLPADPGVPEAPPSAPASAPDESTNDLTIALLGFGSFPPAMMTPYFPLALKQQVAMLPMTIALVICFLPFIVAVSSLIREKEDHTLEILLSAPDIDGVALLLAKALLPVAVTIFNFLLMVVIVETLSGLHTKGGLVETLFMIMPGLIAASLLGVAASTLVTSQTQAVMASASYFFCLTLLTGFVTPLPEASPVVQALSRLLPLTFVMTILDAWFVGAGPRLPDGAWWFGVQVLLAAVTAALSFRGFLRRI